MLALPGRDQGYTHRTIAGLSAAGGQRIGDFVSGRATDRDLFSELAPPPQTGDRPRGAERLDFEALGTRLTHLVRARVYVDPLRCTDLGVRALDTPAYETLENGAQA
jgi:hypothetical protein